MPPCSKKSIRPLVLAAFIFLPKTAMRQSLESGTLLELFTMTQKVSFFFNSKPSRGVSPPCFSYCVRVVCSVLGFLEKNRDSLSSDLIQLVHKSTGQLLKQAFHDALSSLGTKSILNPRIITKPASVRVGGLFHTVKAVAHQ